uniref:Uncharacterized protein n=1 Tax=Rhipicephalus zambeziensis TaxID=60191 RepID=A0A224Y9S9_9ACAR
MVKSPGLSLLAPSLNSVGGHVTPAYLSSPQNNGNRSRHLESIVSYCFAQPWLPVMRANIFFLFLLAGQRAMSLVHLEKRRGRGSAVCSYMKHAYTVNREQCRELKKKKKCDTISLPEGGSLSRALMQGAYEAGRL